MVLELGIQCLDRARNGSFLEQIASVREEYEEIIKHEVQVAIASDQEAIDRLAEQIVAWMEVPW